MEERRGRIKESGERERGEGKRAHDGHSAYYYMMSMFQERTLLRFYSVLGVIVHWVLKRKILTVSLGAYSSGFCSPELRSGSQLRECCLEEHLDFNFRKVTASL